MKERLDTILKYAIYGYAIVCIIGYFTTDIGLINALIFRPCTTYNPYSGIGGCNIALGEFPLIILALLIVIRFIVFGKTYQK